MVVKVKTGIEQELDSKKHQKPNSSNLKSLFMKNRNSQENKAKNYKFHPHRTYWRDLSGGGKER